MNHSFNVSIACDFSVDSALFVNHIEHWTIKNLANKKNIHDGFCWTYDTLEALGDIFPYWSKGQRERVINNTVAQGLIIRGNYNTIKYDRTIWYALSYKSYSYFDHLLNEKYLKALWLSISRNQEMDFLKWRNGFPEIRKTIPDTIPYTDPIKLTTNCENPAPVSQPSSSSFVFSETLDKSMLSQKLEHDIRSDVEFLSHIKEHVDNHSNKKFARMQRAQAALKLLQKLREQNVIFYVAGKSPDEINTQNVSAKDPTKPSVTDFQEYRAGVKGYEFVGEWLKNNKK